MVLSEDPLSISFPDPWKQLICPLCLKRACFSESGTTPVSFTFQSLTVISFDPVYIIPPYCDRAVIEAK